MGFSPSKVGRRDGYLACLEVQAGAKGAGSRGSGPPAPSTPGPAGPRVEVGRRVPGRGKEKPRRRSAEWREEGRRALPPGGAGVPAEQWVLRSRTLPGLGEPMQGANYLNGGAQDP